MARKKTLKSTIDEAAAMLAPAVPVPPASGDRSLISKRCWRIA